MLAALGCGLIYFGFGTQWAFRPRPTLYVHHTLTAQAWLKGRLHVTSGEIEQQYMCNALRRGGQGCAVTWDDQQVRAAYDHLQGEYFRSLGVPEDNIPAEISGSLRRAYLDWVRIGDRYYAYWPPVPTALLVPLVWLFGPGFSDVIAANAIGAATVLLVYWMLCGLRRHWAHLRQDACLALALFYGLGTCHMYQACMGQVWLIAQLTATFFLVVATALTLHGAALEAGGSPSRGSFVAGACALALGFLSRNTILLAAPFFVGLLWVTSRRTDRPESRFIKVLIPCVLVVAIAVCVQLAFNHVRFGHPLDFGQGRLADEGGDPLFSEEFKTYGRFDLYYVPRNVWHYFLNPALRQYPAYDPAQAGLTFDPMGNSLFLVSPLFLYLFAGLRHRPAWQRNILWAGAIPGLTALMLYHNTGWYQFGQRYLLDVLPFLILLTALGLRGRLTRTSLVLMGLSMTINAWGTHRIILEQG